ncbi:zinc finger protein 836 isoform X2 [Bicyclus anynana]|uniref:Zinc finger protein 836 isoform X2 n=1 Tax=Bicyclus anynana TaxID=110368 RepID=A0ABM3M0R9_BICAN|nr:zinc finger protein 836 isoform X2 [Bicyclus anynana]
MESREGAGFPEYLCYQCVTYVQNCKRFRDRCQRAYFTLKEILHQNKEITKSIIEAIDVRAIKISSNLGFLGKERVKTKIDNIKFKTLPTNVNADPPAIQSTPLANNILYENQNLDNIKNENDTYSSDAQLDDGTHFNMADDTEIMNESFEIAPQDDNDYDMDFDVDNSQESKVVINVEGSKVYEEYAELVQISINEAAAVVDIRKLAMQGTHYCNVCERRYNSEERLNVHMRMHDTHVSGSHMCMLCKYYYKTEFLLKVHMTDKHMYKYLCRKCPEVTFDRASAKHHYLWSHIQKQPATENEDATDNRPIWMRNRQMKSQEMMPRKKKSFKLPKDFLTYSPLGQEEQYAIVRERQNTKNYTESAFKCEYCFKGFRESGTYNKHMQKHDPAVSGKLQCDMCKVFCPNARKMYKHMNMTHLFKYTCELCNYVCYNRGQAQTHYRWHKNVTFTCPHCDKVFYKASTQLTHIRIKHPSMFICNLCGHSFVSQTGLYCHKKLAHSKQEVEESSGSVDTSNPLYCSDCRIQFRDDAAFATHFGSSNKHADTNLSIKPVRTRSERPRGRPRRDNSDIVNTGVPTPTKCEICQKFLATDVQARRHYEAEHPGAEYLKRYMCDICGHTTRQYANLMVHMRTHTQEKPYACPHCERRFSMPSNRDRHLVVHTGEKRYQCQHCNRRFTQSSAVKLHIQTVHLKIPYAPWDKKNRKRRREMEVAPLPPPPPVNQKIVLDSQLPVGNYLSAYITYNE